jgi:hypothetical protein
MTTSLSNHDPTPGAQPSGVTDAELLAATSAMLNTMRQVVS